MAGKKAGTRAEGRPDDWPFFIEQAWHGEPDRFFPEKHPGWTFTEADLWAYYQSIVARRDDWYLVKGRTGSDNSVNRARQLLRKAGWIQFYSNTGWKAV